MNYLLPRNWSKYSRRYSGDEEGLRYYKRIILVSQFTIIGTVTGVLHALEDLVDGLVFMPTMDAIMAVSIFCCYLLNERGYHRIARTALLTFLNLFFFVYSSLAHPDLGIYLYFFSWVGLAAVVFEIHENFLRFFFIGLSALLVVLLFATNFQIFGSYSFEVIALERSFIINFVTSITVLVFFIVLMVNMNEQSERKLVELATEVKEKNRDLEKVNRELDRFFYSASHDLRVPLLDMKGAIHSALAEIKDEKVLEYFEVLKNRADKLDHFLQDVIDYSRNSQTEVRVEAVNMAQLVENTIDNFTFIKGSDRIRFIRDVRLDYEVEVDRVRLMIIMNNILSNSIKYHRSEEPDQWVRITCYFENGFLHLAIEDNGQGIEEDLIPKIFNMFFRGTSQSKGSGLGLYIVKEMLDKMGGVIAVKSVLGQRTEFTFSIPCVLVKPVSGPAREFETVPVS